LACLGIAQATLDLVLPRRRQLAVRAARKAIDNITGDRGSFDRIELERGF
jgi:hypothetical protein